MAKEEQSVEKMTESLEHLSTILKQPEIAALLRKRLEVVKPDMAICSGCCLLAGGGAQMEPVARE